MICNLDINNLDIINSTKINVFTTFYLEESSKFNYKNYFKMFMKSLLLTNNSEDINLIIIVNDISEKYINDNKELIEDLKINIYFLSIDWFNQYISTVRVEGWPSVILSRLFLYHLFLNVEKAIYLDIDTLICCSLKEIYNMNVEDNVYLGFKDIAATRESYYLNSGVLLMNFIKLRERYKRPQDIIDFYIEVECKHDQEFVNANQPIIKEDIVFNYPGLYRRKINMNSRLVKVKLSIYAKNAKIFHFYPKEDYCKYNNLFNIIEENNDIFKKCFIADTFLQKSC